MQKVSKNLPRYCPQRTLPDAAYLPGHGPHPSTQPEAKWDLEAWEGSESTLLENREFRWGIDLYNHHFYWEAHEVWEGLWKQAAKHSMVRNFLQGLIQCAGAALKASQGQGAGCGRLTQKGLAKLDQITSETLCRGLDVPGFARSFRTFAADSSPAKAPPAILLMQN